MSPPLKTAHVLFVDVVGYSLLPLVEQPNAMQELQRLILGSPEFQRAEAAGQVLRLPTGDGAALVFFSEAAAPLRCALEIAHRTAGISLPIRMGIHSGPVYLLEDINARLNVSGTGINIAQRVMDCGDAGHILLSDAAVAALGDDGTWSDLLHDLGDAEVKHGLPLRLFNCYAAEVGNPDRPSRLDPQRASTFPAAPQRISWLDSEGGFQHLVVTGPAAGGRGPCRPLRVVVLAQRGRQPDESVADLLVSQLAAHGHDTFSGQALPVGLEWAGELHRRIAAADAVIPLLSRGSVEGSWLAACLRSAREEAGSSGGRPRRLPVRVVYTSPLPAWLEALLGTGETAQWEGPHDDQRLVADLVGVLGRGFLTEALATLIRPDPDLSSTLQPSEDPFAAPRPAKAALLGAIGGPDATVWIQGLPGTGKSRLLAAVLDEAGAAGWRSVRTDLDLMDPEMLREGASFFPALAREFARQLGLPATAAPEPHPRHRPADTFDRFLQNEVLANLHPPVFWALDGIERVLDGEIGAELLEIFRVWGREHSTASLRPASRLSVAVCFPRAGDPPPGYRVPLADLTAAEIAAIHRRCGSPLAPRQLDAFSRRIGGVPALVRQGLQIAAAGQLAPDDLLANADRDDGPFADHLLERLYAVAGDPARVDAVRALISGRAHPSDAGLRGLHAAGIAAGAAPPLARFRSPLYRAYLSRHLD